MLNINIQNYEEFVLDYLENNLSPEVRDAFVMFINEHPEIKEEIEQTTELEFASAPILFESKDQLKKESPIKELDVLDFMSIASLEGDLCEKENLEFLHSLDLNLENKKSFELYQLTKLNSDDFIVFSKKSSLKKTGRKLFYSISAAASVAILIALYLFVPNSINKRNIELAQLDRTPLLIENEFDFNKTQIKTPLASIKTLKAERLKLSQTDLKDDQFSIIAEKITDSNEIVKHNITRINKIDPVQLKIKSDYNNYNELASVYFSPESKYQQNDDLNMKSYLTKSFNKRVLNQDKKKIEWFDIAQASVNGINRIFGVKMKLEKVYNEKGEHEKTEFTSSLLAVSAPVKK